MPPLAAEELCSSEGIYSGFVGLGVFIGGGGGGGLGVVLPPSCIYSCIFKEEYLV